MTAWMLHRSRPPLDPRGLIGLLDGTKDDARGRDDSGGTARATRMRTASVQWRIWGSWGEKKRCGVDVPDNRKFTPPGQGNPVFAGGGAGRGFSSAFSYRFFFGVDRWQGKKTRTAGRAWKRLVLLFTLRVGYVPPNATEEISLRPKFDPIATVWLSGTVESVFQRIAEYPDGSLEADCQGCFDDRRR